jgi:hypothetical protein
MMKKRALKYLNAKNMQERFQVTKDIMKQQTLLTDNPRSMFLILLIKYDVIWTLHIIDCYIEDREERSRLSDA